MRQNVVQPELFIRLNERQRRRDLWEAVDRVEHDAGRKSGTDLDHSSWAQMPQQAVEHEGVTSAKVVVLAKGAGDVPVAKTPGGDVLPWGLSDQWRQRLEQSQLTIELEVDARHRSRVPVEPPRFVGGARQGR